MPSSWCATGIPVETSWTVIAAVSGATEPVERGDGCAQWRIELRADGLRDGEMPSGAGGA